MLDRVAPGRMAEARSAAGELILVCDIGGGTTDFSLITVVETPTGPGFRRVAVGDHLMLGGDNIDLALAHKVEKPSSASVRLDTEQWSACATRAGPPRRSCWASIPPSAGRSRSPAGARGSSAAASSRS